MLSVRVSVCSRKRGLKRERESLREGELKRDNSKERT